MNRFRVGILGENVWLDLDDELTRVGFRVTRVVDAQDCREAGRKSFAMVATELDSKVVKGTAPGVRLHIESCEPLTSMEPTPDVQPGFLWFPAEDQQPQ